MPWPSDDRFDGSHILSYCRKGIYLTNALSRSGLESERRQRPERGCPAPARAPRPREPPPTSPIVLYRRIRACARSHALALAAPRPNAISLDPLRDRTLRRQSAKGCSGRTRRRTLATTRAYARRPARARRFPSLRKRRQPVHPRAALSQTRRESRLWQR